jgi:hypothetical protein
MKSRKRNVIYELTSAERYGPLARKLNFRYGFFPLSRVCSYLRQTAESSEIGRLMQYVLNHTMFGAVAT